MSMQAAQKSLAEPHGGGAALMDGDFIARNQIVERYLSGRLPLKGAQDFERYCREHPQLLDEIGLTERINVALRLLEAGGRAPPWETRAKPWWEKLPALIGAGALALVLGIVSLVLFGKLAAREHAIEVLQRQVAVQPLEPAQSTRSITLIPNRAAPSLRSLVTIGGSQAEMADLKIDVSWTKFIAFRVTIDRVNQGRVAVLHNVLKDSNGVLHLALNSSALGPGNYQLSIDGLNWRGEPEPIAWATITMAR
jgi:hypothetical protein